MYMAIAAAATSALDLLSSLTNKSTTKKTGVTQTPSSPFNMPTASGSSPGQIISSSNAAQSGALSPTTLNALFSSQDPSQSSSSSSRSAAMQDLFSQLDGNGDGAISKSEFEDKLGAGGTNVANADKVFGELDSNGDGSVSLTELASALKSKGHGHAHGAGGKGGSSADALLQALDGASSTTVTNSDGSTTTTMTYADGSTVTLNTPATASGSTNSNGAAASASSKYNLVEQMIQKQAQALATSAKQSLSVSV